MYAGLNCFPNLETVMGIEIERQKLVVILEIHILIGSLVYSSTFKVDLSLHAPLAQKYPPLGQVWDCKGVLSQGSSPALELRKRS